MPSKKAGERAKRSPKQPAVNVKWCSHARVRTTRLTSASRSSVGSARSGEGYLKSNEEEGRVKSCVLHPAFF
jgi:hypothetical protein